MTKFFLKVKINQWPGMAQLGRKDNLFTVSSFKFFFFFYLHEELFLILFIFCPFIFALKFWRVSACPTWIIQVTFNPLRKENVFIFQETTFDICVCKGNLCQHEVCKKRIWFQMT